MSTKKRPIYDYYVNDICYHSTQNMRRCKMNPESLNPFNRPEYRIVDCKMGLICGEKYIFFYTLLAYGQMKIIKALSDENTKEVYSIIKKTLKENQPVCVKFGSLATVPFVAPTAILGISVYADSFSIAYIPTDNLSIEEREYYTAPFTKIMCKQMMY